MIHLLRHKTSLQKYVAMSVAVLMVFSSVLTSFPIPARAAAPVLQVEGWKDGQNKVVLSFNEPVHDGSFGSLAASDFSVSGVNAISILSVSHAPMTEKIILTLASNLNSAGGTDFTIGCALNAVYNPPNEACTTSGVNIYTSVPEDVTGPVVRGLMQMGTTQVFVEFNEVVENSTLLTGNFTLTTADGGDNSTITSVNGFDRGVEISASGAIIASGTGNTVAVSTSVTDVFGNASLGETVKILPTIVMSEIKVAGASNTKDEFIELFNFGPQSVNLSGLKLHAWNQGTTTDTNLPLTFFNASIPANGFYLIAPSTFASGNGANPDATYSTATAQLVANGAAYISFSATADTDVIDLVGWGTSTKKEGTALADIAAGTSVERKSNLDSTAAKLASGGSDQYNGNAMDFNDNLQNFVVQATPVPQDSFFSPEFPFGATFNQGGDLEPPTVVDSFPNAAAASFVPSFLEIAGVDFSESMDAATITTSTVKLIVNSAPGTNLCQSVNYNPNTTFGASTTCTVNPASLPLSNVAHSFIVTTGVTDIAGNAITSEYSVSFTPQASTSFSSQATPDMVGSFPSKYSTNFPPNADFLSVNFSNSLDPSTVTGNVTLRNTTTSSNETITSLSTRTIMKANDSIEVDVSGVTFVAGNAYELTVTTGVTSSSGIAIPTNIVIPFTASSSVDNTGPIVTATHPANSSTGIPVGKPIINVSLDDSLTPSSVNTNSVKLLDGADELPITVNYNSDWREIELVSNSAFEPNTTYTIQLGSAGNANPIQNVGGIDLQDTDGTPNTVYSFSFTTGAADVTAPSVNFATATQNRIQVTFSELMSPSSIENFANWSLESPVGSAVPLSAMAGSTISWDPGSMTAELTGFSLTSGASFEVTVGTGIKDMSGNALATSETLGGSVLDVATYGESLGPDAGFKGDVWDMPTGFSTSDFGFVPQPGVFPMNAMAGKTSNYMVDVPISQQIRSNANSGKVVLTFPTGFDVTNAVAVTNSPKNKDVNGPGPGTVALNAVSVNAQARTVTVNFTIATRCDNGNIDPCASANTQDFIGFDIAGIVNSTVPRSWETSGYTVDIKTMTGTTVLETMTSMSFFVTSAGSNSLTVNLTAAGANTGTTVVHAWSPSTGELTATSSTFTGGTATASFTGLPSDFFDVWTDPLLTIAAADDFAGFQRQPVFVTGSASINKTFQATGSLQTVTVNVTGATGKDIDVIASGPNGFLVKRIASTTGSDSVILKLADGQWFLNIGPHMSMDGGFIMPEPPDYVVAPKGLPITVANPSVTESSGTSNDGTVAFALTGTSETVSVKVLDTNGNPMVNAKVYMDSTTDGFGTFGETSAQGLASLNIVPGVYRVGAFLPGAPPSGEHKVKIDAGGNIYQDGSTTAVPFVTLKLSKGGYTISGTVTDGTNQISGSAVHAFCTANCNGYFGAGAMTDSTGRYTLYVNNGTWNVEAFIPGYGPTTATSVTISSADQSGVNLSPGADTTFYTISGTVCTVSGGAADCTTGTGLSGIEIHAYSSAGGGGQNFAKTGSDGTYSLRVPAATGYVVEARDLRKGPMKPLTGIDASSANQTGKDVVIDTPESVTVNVKNAGGSLTPVNEMFVDFVDDTNDIRQHVMIKNNSVGSITLPEGDYKVFVHMMAAQLNPTTAVVSDDAGTTVTSGVLTVDGSEIIKIVVPTLYALSGQLTDGSNPVANAWVEVSDATNGIFLGAMTDASGNYSLNVSTGTYQVNAYAPGLILNPVTSVVSGATVLNLVGSITTLSISGQVTDPNSNVVPYAFVRASKDGNAGVVAGQADASGNYSISVNAGSWNLTANGYGYEPVSYATSVVIVDASVTGKNLQFTTEATGLNAPTSKTMTPSEGGIASDDTLGLNVTVPGNATSTSSSAGTLSMKETNNIVSTASTEVVGNGFEISMTDNGGTQLTSGFTEDVGIERTVAKATLVSEGKDT